MEEELNIAEVKKALEDANLYEPDMPENVMVSYYKAVTDSKNTATEEDETRRLNESQKDLLELLHDNKDSNTPIVPKNKTKLFTPKNWTSEKKTTSTEVTERNNNENKEDATEPLLEDESPKDATKESFGFNEMAKDSDKSLQIISHKIKFIPIQNTKNFLNANLSEKAKLLYVYHTKLNKMKTQLARMSFYPAPLPRITSVIDTFPNSTDDVDFQETYICRSGRQTKRKVYNYDDEDSLEGVTSKKTKNSEEQEWLCKPNKTSVRSKKSDPAKMDVTEVELSATNDINSTTTDEPVKEPKKVDPKPTVLRKLSNEEIMKRSRIFSDTPRRRCEALFDKLKDSEEKRQREERVMEAFNKTLENLDGEDNDDEDIIPVDHEGPSRRRVVPPIRRRPINRKRSLAPLNVTVNSSTQKKETPNKQGSSPNQDVEMASPRTGRRRPNLLKASGDEGIENLPSTSQLPANTDSPQIMCPICNGSFRDDEIEEHAATCGDDPDSTSSVSKVSRITCKYCDVVIPPEIDLNTHEKECRLKKDEDS